MRKFCITAYPYATVYGEINIPNNVKNIEEYIDKHFDDIEFGSPDLDFAGTDFDYYEED